MSLRKKIMKIPRLELDKIPLRYVDQPNKLSQFFRSFENYADHFKESHEKLDTVTDGFINGTMSIISGDLKFEQGMHAECIEDFSKASEIFLRTKKIAEGQIKEEIIKVNDQVMRELGRRAVYAQARITHAEALIELKKAKKVTPEERNILKQFLELASQAYMDEITVEDSYDDFYHKLITRRNIHKVKIRLEEQIAELSSTITDKREHLYRAMVNAQKAIFLGEKKIPQIFFESTKAKIKNLTIEKYVKRADYFWMKGLEKSSAQNFSEASQLFWAGKHIYDIIKKFENRTEFNLQSKMFHVTAIENDAKFELRNDNNKQSSFLFMQAADLMSSLIKLVKEIGNKDLVDLFNIQSAYFDGMRLFCTGLLSYDEENFKAALKTLKVSQRSLKAVLNSARELENQALIASCKDGLKQIETYLETLELVVEEEEGEEKNRAIVEKKKQENVIKSALNQLSDEKGTLNKESSIKEDDNEPPKDSIKEIADISQDETKNAIAEESGDDTSEENIEEVAEITDDSSMSGKTIEGAEDSSTEVTKENVQESARSTISIFSEEQTINDTAGSIVESKDLNADTSASDTTTDAEEDSEDGEKENVEKKMPSFAFEPKESDLEQKKDSETEEKKLEEKEEEFEAEN